MRSIATLSMALLAACSGEPAPVAPVPRPDPAIGSSASPSSEPSDPALPAPNATRAEPRALELPETIPEPTTLRVRRRRVAEHDSEPGLAWDEVQHPSPAVQPLLAALVEQLTREMSEEAYYDTECDVMLAHESLVSLRCSGAYDVRGGTEQEVLAAHVAIHEGRIRPFSIDEALRPGSPLESLAVTRCDAQREATRRRAIEDMAWFYEDPCEWARAFPVLGPRGVHVRFVLASGIGLSIDVEVPYGELREHLRAGGPLAPVLAGTRASPPAPPDDEAVDAWAVSGFRIERALVSRWMELDPAESAGVSVQRWRGGLARLVIVGADPDRARRIAPRFDSPAEPLALGDSTTLPLRWARTTSDLNLRDAPRDTSETLGVAPEGAIVAALGAELGQQGEWAQAESPLGHGNVAARYLRLHEGCIPAAPDGMPAAPRPLVALVSVRRSGRARPGVLFAQSSRRETRVALHAFDEAGCVVGEAWLTFRAPGRMFDLRMTATTEHGGSSIVVFGSPGEDRRQRYVAYRVGSRAPIWSQELESYAEGERLVRLGESADGRYFPISYGLPWQARRLAWTGAALEEQAPPVAP